MSESFGVRLKNFRKQKGLTQDELAEKVDISTNYLSKVERGINVLNAETFLKIADVLSFSLEDFGIKIKSDNAFSEQQELLTKILSATPDKVKLFLKRFCSLPSLSSKTTSKLIIYISLDSQVIENI